MSNSTDKARNALTALLEVWKTGTAVKLIADSFLIRAADHPDIPCHRWSLNNQMLMLISGTMDARGYRQWQQTGRHVKKGCRSFCILGPRMVKRENDAGEKVAFLAGFRAIPVFRYEDTEGEPVDYPDYSPDIMPPLHDVAETIGSSVRWWPTDPTRQSGGYYQPGTGEIVLHTHDPAVFMHELAHAVDYHLGLATPGRDKKNAKAKETVAETVAAVLCRLYAIDHDAPAQGYVQFWNPDTDPVKAVMGVLKRVEAVLTFIMDTSSDMSGTDTITGNAEANAEATDDTPATSMAA